MQLLDRNNKRGNDCVHCQKGTRNYQGITTEEISITYIERKTKQLLEHNNRIGHHHVP